MTSAEFLYLVFGSFLVGLSLFCANLLFVQKNHRQVYWPLGLFFVAEAASSVSLVLDAVAQVYDAADLVRILVPLNMPFSLMLAPLFWLYVRGLTAEPGCRDLRHKGLHAAPPIFGAVLTVLFLLLPAQVYEALERGEAVTHPLVPVLVAGLWALNILFYAQVSFYVVLTLRLLARYNSRLKDLFASTEDRELHWIWWILIASVCFVTFNVANLLAVLIGVRLLPQSLLEQPLVDLVLSAGIIWVLALWGLRQQPGLVEAPAAQPPTVVAPAPKEPAPKYERSALSEAQAQRLARKIRSAMLNDLLYRDPNLSLWDLSKHIGVTSNYLSQTLNETIGSTFFDYVNQWRIEDAAQRVQDSDETILAIAYDVGFNSKSSFYKAFKKHVGMTPSALRAARGTSQALSA